MTLARPFPPEHLAFEGVGGFVPSPELLAWARSTFIEDGASLQNPEHEHLQQAKLGFLWTNEPNGRRGRVILGTCQLLPPTGDKWSIGARVLQLSEWFVGMPDFLITIFAPAAVEMDNASFMALVEHELYHASQKRSAEGEPMFSRETGEPIWATRAHDVEQFVGVVRRYGAQAAMVEDMVAAANAGPEIAPARIAFGCGNCL